MDLPPEEQSAMDGRYSHTRLVANTFYERHNHQQIEEQTVRMNIKRKAGESTRGLAFNQLRVAQTLTSVSLVKKTGLPMLMICN